MNFLLALEMLKLIRHIRPCFHILSDFIVSIDRLISNMEMKLVTVTNHDSRYINVTLVVWVFMSHSPVAVLWTQ